MLPFGVWLHCLLGLLSRHTQLLIINYGRHVVKTFKELFRKVAKGFLVASFLTIVLSADL
jgi:hypothetical protein